MDSSPTPDPFAELAALLHQLGGQPFAIPFQVGNAPPVMALGTLAGLAVWASAGPPQQTVQVARRLARRGRLGLVLGAEVGSNQWLAAMSVIPVRPVSVLRGDASALPLRRLARAVRSAPVTPLEQAVAFAEALDVDAAGRKTFRLLHRLVGRAVEMLPRSIPADDRHGWALMQLTRLLFLRFVEAEGWLDGNVRFLATAFDRCLIAHRDPTRDPLHPLFFGTLNRPCDQRSRLARAFGAIPFLNGGLFEPHPIERRVAMHLPVAYWREAFEALVERVEVTLDGEADDGRVAPELLGRVFEGVMHPTERREQGTFFTPPALVDAMVREALTSHLAPRIGRGEAELARALDEPDPLLRRTLLDVTVLDPAAGSGAFLVGALALLHGPGRREVRRVRFLVTRRLFGVDRHPDAVRLCELRLWL
ncbi:MAG TPA: N-6 DNA methylase, partial [Gemmatimonadales bacterium]